MTTDRHTHTDTHTERERARERGRERLLSNIFRKINITVFTVSECSIITVAV